MEGKELVKKYTEVVLDLATGFQKPGAEPFYDAYFGKVGVELMPVDGDTVNPAIADIRKALSKKGFIEIACFIQDDPGYIIFKHLTERMVATLTLGNPTAGSLYLWVGLNDDDVELINSKELVQDCHYSGECECRCPFGGDEHDDCADCAYAGDYHFVDGECVLREADDYAEMQSMADQVDGVQEK